MGRTSRTFAVVLVLALLAAIAGTVAMAASPAGGFDRMVMSLWGLLGACMTAFVCAVVFDRGRMRRLMIVGISAGFLGWIAVQPYVWLDLTRGQAQTLSSIGPALFVVAGYAMIVGTFSQVRVWRRWARRVRRGTIGLATLLAAAAIITIVGMPIMREHASWQAHQAFDEVTYRVCSSLGILTGLGVLATLVAVALPKLDGEGAAPEAQRLEFWMTCPRCGAHERKRTEGDACTACGLNVKVTPT